MSINIDLLDRIIISSSTTVVAELITIPICTIKTIVQTTETKNSIPKIISYTYKSRGLKGFYAASLPASLSTAIALTAKYSFYEQIKKKRQNNISDLKNNLINGMLAASAASIFHHPFDVVKIHNQRGDKIKTIINRDGIIKTFTRGYYGTVGRNIMTSMTFPVYDYCKYQVTNNDLPLIIAPISSAIITTTLLQWVDFIRNNSLAGTSWFNHGNILKYYNGYSLGLLRNVIHFTIFMTGIDFVKKRFYN